MFLYIFIFFIVILISSFEWWKLRQRRGVEMPPRHPLSWPIIGLTHLLLRLRDTKCFFRVTNDLAGLSYKYGGVVYGYIGHILVYVVTDPEDCRTVLNTCLEKKFAYSMLKRWGGDGLATSTLNLALWRRHRKIISRAFNQQVLDSYMETFNKKSQQLVSALAQKVNVGSFEHMSHLTEKSLGIMYETTFGFEDDGSLEDIIGQEHKEIISSIYNIVAMRFKNYWMHSDLLYRFSWLKKKDDRIYESLNNITNAILRRKHEELAKTDRKSSRVKSFLDLLMELPSEDAFSDQELKDEVNNMMLAGSDTTATTLAYALMLLGSHKNVQDDVYQELKAVFGDSNRDVEKEDLSKLVLLDAVLMETLRLYPQTPILPRYVSEDVQIKNYTLPAGSTCLVCIHHVHLNPDIWGEHSKRFRPQRWIEGVSPAASRAFFGFSNGKRNCLGRMYAMTSMKTTLAHVLRHYSVDGDVTKLELQLDLLLKPASGCEIAVMPRKK